MNAEEYLKWVEGLKVGDTVAVEHSYSTYSLGKVEEITRHRIRACGREFKRAGFSAGYSVKSRPHDATHRLLPVTDKIRQAVRRRKMLNRVTSMRDEHWEKLPEGTLAQIYNLIVEAEQKT